MYKNNRFHIRFKIRLFLWVTVVCTFIALLVSYLFSLTSDYNTRNTEINSGKIILEQASTQIESLYEQMNIAATSTIKNKTLKNIIIELNNTSEDATQHQMTEELQKARTIETILTNMMFSSTISNVLLYDKKNQFFYYTGIYLKDKNIIQNAMLYNSDQADVINDTYTKHLGPHQSPWIKEEKPVLSVIRNFSDNPSTYSTAVEIQIPCTQLDKICMQKTFGDEKELVMLNSNFEIIYPYNQEYTVLDSNTIHTIITSMIAGKQSDYSDTYMYISKKIVEDNFYLLFLSNNKSIKKVQKANFRTTLFTVFIVLTATLLIIFIIISLVTKPLRELINHIKMINLDENARLNISNQTFDEFEIISDSFNQMLTKLKESLKQTYEAKIRESNANLSALQAQINPHFLYNALNSISAASEAYGSEVTTKMCQEFSSMMRYITSQNQNRKLIEEIQHAKNYLDFMKISYDGNFDYTIQIPLELYNLIIPKLTIQPLIENSFKHGFQNSLPPYQIEINCYCENEYWVIQITDNGQGFSKEAQEEFYSFQEKYSDERNKTSFEKLSIEGMGLKNIYCRLYIHYKQNISFLIHTEEKICTITLKGELKDA